QLRLQHDGLATDDKARLEPMCLAEYLISGPGGMDPDIEIDDDTYDECREVLSRILEDAYTQSGTFRRLMNYAYDQELHDVEQRW
ncbi:type III secretion system effector protease GogA, partial [Salmonella enterica]|nr:type III secretion system effector protease GogA [Salmonella enterica]MCA5627504.1 type III secretion system effector protease GogA [Salmonella enterica]MCA5632146.1 type III secretion system effector protease GogA [Salmonella enterica]MCA5636789.1 type III secretion system effector protease GogA [Salmonella enterica]MCA5641432.1 type III secretion system effector protease GogA [Salmonella enterica]